ncbi:MAG: DNA gyrase modulator [Chitinophagaceae bacterium]
MKRRNFIQYAGMGLGGALLSHIPLVGNAVSPEVFLDNPLDTVLKKQLADTVLNTAKSKGASYADVRIGRYLRQYTNTREHKVENISNTESYGIGIRVLVNGCWGFSATNKMDKDSIVKATNDAVTIARVNAKLQSEPVQLAPQKGYGEVSWKTPVEKNGFAVPVKEKVDLLLAANDAALAAGASFITNSLFLINEQKYFASTEGSYIDQDIHRIWPTFTVTKTDKASGKFETRNALSAPSGMGYEYLTPNEADKIKGRVTVYKNRYDMLEDVKAAALQLDEKLKAKPLEPGKYDSSVRPYQFIFNHSRICWPPNRA